MNISATNFHDSCPVRGLTLHQGAGKFVEDELRVSAQENKCYKVQFWLGHFGVSEIIQINPSGDGKFVAIKENKKKLKTFDDYMCRGKIPCRIISEELQIKIKYGEKEYTMDVQWGETALDIKKKIEKEMDTPMDRQTLCLGHKKFSNADVLIDPQTFVNKSSIELHKTIDLTISINGEEQVFQVPSNKMGFELKKMILSEDCSLGYPEFRIFPKETTRSDLKVFLQSKDCVPCNTPWTPSSSLEQFGVNSCVTVMVRLAFDDGEKDLTIFVKDLCAVTRFLDLINSDTVETMKLKHQKKCKVSPDQQRLIFAGKQLDDGRTVQSYGIRDDAILHMVLRLRGGGGGPPTLFADVSNTNAVITRPWSESAPNWRVVKDGRMSLEGICENESCRAHGHMVIHNEINSEFDLILDAGLVCCPICHKKVIPKKPGFNNCFYRIEGIKAEEELDGEIFIKDWKRVGNNYETYNEGEAGEAKWKRLQFFIRPLTCVGHSITKLPVPSHCAICFDKMEHPISTLTCGHHFHEDCIEGWDATCITDHKKTTCPLCRSDGTVELCSPEDSPKK